MNILHIHRRFYPNIGGVEKYIYNLSTRLMGKNINCKVVTLDYDIFNKKNKNETFEIIDGIEVYRIPGFGHYKKPVPLKIPIGCFKWADIVHVHDLRFLYETTLFLKKIYKYKIIFSTHGFIFHTNEFVRFKRFTAEHYYKPTITKYIDSVICDSKQDYNYFNKWNLNNIILFENSIDFNKFNRIGRNTIQGSLLYFGRVDRNKGLDMLLKSLSLIKEKKWHLDIAGHGAKDIVEKIKQQSIRLGISERITWYGFLEDRKLFDLINKAQLCLFPSTYEGFGFTLVEAMAAGSICIANRIETYKDIIENNIDGYLADFMQTEKVAKKIKKLLSEPIDRMVSIENNAIKKAKSYDWSDRINEIIRIYKMV